MLLSVPAPNVERFDTEIPVWALDLLETLFFSLQLLMCELWFWYCCDRTLRKTYLV